MCMEDVKIGRNSSGQFRTIVVTTAAPIVIAPANNSRIALTFAGDGVETFYLSPNGEGGVFEAGILVTKEMGTFTLTLENVGSLLFQSWSARAKVGDTLGSIFDVTLNARKSSELTEY